MTLTQWIIVGAGAALFLGGAVLLLIGFIRKKSLFLWKILPSIAIVCGLTAGIVTAVNLGAFAIEPQILYVRQGLRIKPEGAKEINLKSNSIDVPVLVSLRLLRPFRFYAGPVFTVMNDCKQKSGGDLLDFGRVRPTMSYTVGAGVKLLGHMLIDLRYNGQFKGKEDVVLPDGSRLDKLRSYNVALSVGYLF